MTRKTTVGSITVPRVWPGHPDWEPDADWFEKRHRKRYSKIMHREMTLQDALAEDASDRQAMKRSV